MLLLITSFTNLTLSHLYLRLGGLTLHNANPLQFGGEQVGASFKLLQALERLSSTPRKLRALHEREGGITLASLKQCAVCSLHVASFPCELGAEQP